MTATPIWLITVYTSSHPRIGSPERTGRHVQGNGRTRQLHANPLRRNAATTQAACPAIPTVVPTPMVRTCAVVMEAGVRVTGPGSSTNTPQVASTITLLTTGAQAAVAKLSRTLSTAPTTTDTP
nr:hypothetical protein [Nocardia otitidiscaviarum]